MVYEHVRNLFVPFLSRDGAPPASLHVAASLAAMTPMHVTVRVLGQRIALPYSPFGEIAAQYVETANSQGLERARAAALAAQSLLEGAGSVVDARAIFADQGDLRDIVGQLGRVHDIAIVDRCEESLAEGRAIIEKLLFSSGRPVIIVPPSATDFRARRIVIAWDGDARAARAVGDAMHFLKQAEYVDIICVTNEKDLKTLVPGAEIAPQLARHGVKAEVTDITAPDRSAARAIRDHAGLVGADLIVMGAYAHSRLQQFVLGGVTDSMLHNSDIPLFMSY